MIPVEPSESGTDRRLRTYNPVAMSQLWNRIVMALSAVGLFVAGVLAYAAFDKKEVPCGVNGGCDVVTNSQWSYLFGNPELKVAYFGFATYVLLFLLAVLRTSATGKNWATLNLVGLLVSGFGFGYSAYLQFISMTQLQQICPWCLASAITMFFVFAGQGMLMQQDVPEDKAKGMTDFGVAAGLAILALGGVGVQSASLEASTASMVTANFGGVTNEELVPVESKTIGTGEAKVTLIEFADINCPACRTSYGDLREVYQQYGGKLRVAYRHFPLANIPGHETSIMAALVAEYAATEGKFWDFMDKAMDLSNTQRIRGRAGVVQIAVESGLDRDAVNEVIDSVDDTYLDSLYKDISLATDKLKLGGTPAFIIVAEGREPETVAKEDIKQTLDRSYGDLLR